ncbi:hypothetical protein [Mycobacteroides abscessus]|uniref:hypothetical protein n=1 Tax=Mycobacteroides abscessus TaxID=36809 RepID=UPI000929BDCF|nr:hypothetical protein [Mycobacteroides abscessus]QSM04911.1 head-to-tail stopper [Mycobacterium phage prophi91-4]MDO3335156.1 hypothetical protein [Mycobacteroides abscessus subsp. bolletii]QSM87810.1 hypothetical protein I3U44_18600 [Mycobacteroides abscessus subsp. bolletii]SIB01777.1 Uncharacterised protein [Mycobacteroides abscessus subsp. bolletii]SII69264.1 Uncharacterised protein [Mycobacteroides abscessus subsp. bolletii]
MPLNISDYQTVIPTRVVDEANNTRAPLPAIDVVAFLDEPQVLLDAQGKRFVQNGILRVRRGSDLKVGDEVPLPEGIFGVVGAPTGNRNHCMTGADFGWARYKICRGG